MLKWIKNEYGCRQLWYNGVCIGWIDVHGSHKYFWLLGLSEDDSDFTSGLFKTEEEAEKDLERAVKEWLQLE